MTPIEWDNLMATDWRKAYPAAQTEAKRYLDTMQVGVELDTKDLIERMYPSINARGDMIPRRDRIFKALNAGVKLGLMDGYVSFGAAKRYMGRGYQPRIWHKRDPNHVEPERGLVECPACGCKFKPEADHAQG